MKAILYARVSSKEQEQEGYSIPAQKKYLYDHALKNKYSVVKEFVDIESAKQSGRKNFVDMVKFLKKNRQIKIVLCEKTDRLSRNFKDIATLDSLINKSDIKIILVKENFVLDKHSRSSDKLMFGFKALIAKHYIDNLSEESKKGMNQKAQEGIFPGLAPLGYKNVTKKENDRVLKTIEIDQTRAPLIKRLFELYSTGQYSLKRMRDIANEEGLRSRTGKKIHTSFIDKMLKNIFYTGSFYWSGKLCQGKHVPLISKKLFNMVQKSFQRFNKPHRLRKRRFAYAGLLKCAKCGSSITAEIHKEKFIYYRCTGYRGCKLTYVREEKIADMLFQAIKKISIDEELLNHCREVFKNENKDQCEYRKTQLKNLEKRKNLLKKRLEKIYVDKIDEKIPEETYDSLSSDWQEELKNINEKLINYQNKDFDYTEEGLKILEFANKILPLYLRQNKFERAKMLNIVLSNCTLDGKKLNPHYKKAFNLLAERSLYPNWGG